VWCSSGAILCDEEGSYARARSRGRGGRRGRRGRRVNRRRHHRLTSEPPPRLRPAVRGQRERRQAAYGVRDPRRASWQASLMRIALAVLSRATGSLGRERLGLSTRLRGSGMGFALSAPAASRPMRSLHRREGRKYASSSRGGVSGGLCARGRVLGDMAPRRASGSLQQRAALGGQRAAIAQATRRASSARDRPARRRSSSIWRWGSCSSRARRSLAALIGGGGADLAPRARRLGDGHSRRGCSRSSSRPMCCGEPRCRAGPRAALTSLWAPVCTSRGRSGSPPRPLPSGEPRNGYAHRGRGLAEQGRFDRTEQTATVWNHWLSSVGARHFKPRSTPRAPPRPVPLSSRRRRAAEPREDVAIDPASAIAWQRLWLATRSGGAGARSQ
jgi:hypothetical protein